LLGREGVGFNLTERVGMGLKPSARQASSGEVKGLRREASDLKELVADLTLENRLLKKSMIGDGGDQA